LKSSSSLATPVGSIVESKAIVLRKIETHEGLEIGLMGACRLALFFSLLSCGLGFLGAKKKTVSIDVVQ